MANLVGKKASTVEALLLDKNDMKQKNVMGESVIVGDTILITNGETETAADGTEFPKVVSKNIITAINDESNTELVHLFVTATNTVDENGKNTININGSEITVEECTNCYNVSNTINGEPISEIFYPNSSMVNKAQVVTKGIQWTTADSNNVETTHTVSLEELFGEGITGAGSAILDAYNRNNGSIETRLETLEAIATASNKTIAEESLNLSGELYKRFDCVVGTIKLSISSKPINTYSSVSLGIIEKDYRPKENFSSVGVVTCTGSAGGPQTITDNVKAIFSVNTDGSMSLKYEALVSASYTANENCTIVIGYKVNV